MGKGDKKTRRGKINIGTFGRLRRRKKATAITTTKAKATAKKTAKKEVEEESAE